MKVGTGYRQGCGHPGRSRSSILALSLVICLGVAESPACSVYDASLLDGRGRGGAGSSGVPQVGQGGDLALGGAEPAGASAVGGAIALTMGGNGGAREERGAVGGDGGGNEALLGISGDGGAGNAGGGTVAADAPAIPTAGSAGSVGSAGGAGSAAINPCEPKNWVATASSASLTLPDLYNPPPFAVDGDAHTRWSSGAPQNGGEWFLLDLGGRARVSQIVLDDTSCPADFPVGYKLELSTDGLSFTLAVNGLGETITRMPVVESATRFIRITQTGSGAHWWSIEEFTFSCTPG